MSNLDIFILIVLVGLIISNAWLWFTVKGLTDLFIRAIEKTLLEDTDE